MARPASGPVAGIDDNVIHLLPTYRSGKLDEHETLGQLADHLKAIAYLMTQLSAKVASIDATGHLETIVSTTARMGETFGSAGTTLAGWDCGPVGRGYSVSSEKNSRYSGIKAAPLAGA